jgi:hypothetical protein
MKPKFIEAEYFVVVQFDGLVAHLLLIDIRKRQLYFEVETTADQLV